MSASGTIRAITRNIQKTLQALGICFSIKTSDDAKDLAASGTPAGEIQYKGEAFEHRLGQGPLYIDAEFAINVFFAKKDSADIVREQQDWVHKIKSAMTVDALNSGELSLSKNISRVEMLRAEAMNQKNRSSISCKTTVRYREG